MVMKGKNRIKYTTQFWIDLKLKKKNRLKKKERKKERKKMQK